MASFLRTNTAVTVCVGPFIDKTDGVTAKTALTVSNCKISITAETDENSAPTLIIYNVAGNDATNTLAHITNDVAGYYSLKLTAANLNRLGRIKISIQDAANHCPVFHEFMVLPAMIYDSLVLNTDALDVSMIQILGTAVSSPATAGILDVNLKNIANAAVSTSTAQLGVNAVQHGGTAQTGRDIGASVLLSNGTGTGQISLSSGAVTVGTNNDKTGYTAATVSDKTGYSLAADQAVNCTKFGGTTVTARDIGASVLLSSGTGTGQLDFTSGVVKANLAQILSTALTETAGYLAAGFKKFFNVATPTGTVNSLPDAVAGATGGLFIAGSNAATTVNFTGNLSGSVGSVTGAVGSVTGNVGGNVTGSVGSVTGAVGSVTGAVGSVTGSVGSIATGGITSGSFASGAIDATAIATDAIGAAELAADAANEIADAILARNVAGGSSTGRTVKEALYALRNKVAVSSGTMTVYGTDDSTSAWTAAVTGTAGADPVTTIDPT